MVEDYSHPPFIVVTDFDGTLTEKDIGNELSMLYRPQLFQQLHASYSRGELRLREFQQQLWTGFPCSESEFIHSSLKAASLRPGVNEFLELCAHKKIPVYIASCGIDLYITSVIERFMSKFAQAAIRGLKSNIARFDEKSITSLLPPDQDPSQAEPLHKGRWAQELSQKHGGAKVIAIGNGGSDKTFLNHVNKIYATEKLIKTCENAQVEFEPFHNFFDILKTWPLK
jgi:2-hydroxy-3-keto-5-methylthiopentenyl-1-phosphate phosphatase